MVSNNNKFPEEEYFFPPVEESSRLLVGCSREDYSASRIARAVEDCNAHLLNLNVTSMGDSRRGVGRSSEADDYDVHSDAKFPVVFDLRVNLRNPGGVSRSLERYGYTVLSTCSADDDAVDDTARRRIDHLFRYLEI